jgi:hypothetical protein
MSYEEIKAYLNEINSRTTTSNISNRLFIQDNLCNEITNHKSVDRLLHFCFHFHTHENRSFN